MQRDQIDQIDHI